MEKKKYVTPELEELGDLVNLTKYSFVGASFDGAFPEDTPEIFGS